MELGPSRRTGVVGVRVGICALLSILCLGVPADSRGRTGAGPEAVLAEWLRALDAGDHAAYSRCLDERVREMPAYGSLDALRFWAGEIEDLRVLGFTGRFRVEAAPVGPRTPRGAVLAFPALGSQRSREAIVLVPVGREWRILRLFS